MRAPTAFRLTSCAATIAGIGALLVSACGGSNKSGSFTSGGGPDSGLAGPFNGDGSVNFVEASTFSEDALAAEDPPNLWCGPEGGAPSEPPIGGTPGCPSDKNLPGCPCSPVGTSAACWPGLRSNRNVGDCKDGTTTCATNGEKGATWGPCTGAVLPDPAGTTAAAQCSCFSQGQWHIDNLVPQFVTYSGDGLTYGVSTVQASDDGGTTVFQPIESDAGKDISEPPPIPSAPWSNDELTVDCAGTFTLCYQLKYGDFNNPLPTDCAVTQKLCLPATYYAGYAADSGAPEPQAFPELPSWESMSTDSTCANEFHTKGGYGEMSVLGQSVLCQEISNGSGGSFVFHRIQYCADGVSNCGQDGSGTFK